MRNANTGTPSPIAVPEAVTVRFDRWHTWVPSSSQGFDRRLPLQRALFPSSEIS